MLTDAYTPRPEPLTAEQITELSALCAAQGYDFRLALRTMARDGKPYLVKH